MSSDKLLYEETFKIRANEINIDQKATLPAICNLLQEVAGNHALELKFDITDLQKEQLTWVLHRLQVEMERLPEWRETITIKTWPSGGDGLRAHRDFLLLDSDENVIGRSLSYWLILDVEKRRPIRIPKKFLDSVPTDSGHVLPVSDGDFVEIQHPNNTKLFTVRKSDLDLNQHVNNVYYVEWALASLPGDSEKNNIDVKFLAEAVMGDTIIVEEETKKGTHNFQLKKKENKKTLALAYID